MGLTWNLFLPSFQRMIAKTVKIVRGCRSQPYGKCVQLKLSNDWHVHVEINHRLQVCVGEWCVWDISVCPLQCLHLHREAWRIGCFWKGLLLAYLHVSLWFSLWAKGFLLWWLLFPCFHTWNIYWTFSHRPDSDHALPLRSSSNVRHYIQNLKVIDNQRKLTQLSRTIEWQDINLQMDKDSGSLARIWTREQIVAGWTKHPHLSK